jgi:uncharacterized protein (DUF1330 family)
MAGDPTRFVQLFGAQVDDDVLYRRYRESMLPIVQRYGGAFSYDFVVSRALISETAHPINRVFAIHFPDRGRAEALFADPSYLAARHAFFVPAVSAITRLAAYDEPVPAGSAPIPADR